MSKFCANCGEKIKEGEKFCSACGKGVEVVEKPKALDVKTETNLGQEKYNKIVGILSVVLGGLIVAGGLFSDVGDAVAFILAGILCAAGGWLHLQSKTDKQYYLYSAIALFVGAVINFISVATISPFAIYSVAIGGINIYFYTKK